jgi:deoxyribonuclease V
MPFAQHPWPTTVEAAIPIQEQMRSQVISTDQLGPVQWVAGVDVGFEDQGRISRAAVAVLEWPSLQLREQALARRPTTLPYAPGFLSFREVPVILAALEQLPQLPDLILCDGQGLAHPRRFGLACHLGVLTDLPTIGVAKSRLLGTHAEVANVRGAWQPLRDQGETVGAVLRTRPGTKPLYVSLGHRISLPTAIHYVLSCLTRYRLPETTRWADRLASDKSSAADGDQLTLL